MKATQHLSNNDVLRAPPGVPLEVCKPLAITRIQYTDGTPGVRSYWIPTPLERRAIADGAMVCLEFQGVTHPPVLPMVDGIPCDGA